MDDFDDFDFDDSEELDGWDKTKREKRFRQKNAHANKEDQAPRQKFTKARRKITRQRIDPTRWMDQDEFCEDYDEDYEF